MPGRFASFLLGLALSTALTRASASEAGGGHPVRLLFDGPLECPDRRAFVTELQRRSPRIHEAETGERAPLMHVELRAVGGGGGAIDGLLTVAFPDAPAGGETGRREIRGADCKSVTDGLALIAVVILDPSATLHVDAPAPPPPEPLPPPPPAARPPPRPPEPVMPLRMAAGAALEAAVGQGPNPMVLPRVYLDLALPGPVSRASARLSVGRSYARGVDTSIGTAQITLTDVRLEPCFEAVATGPIRLHTCALFEGGVLSGQGTQTNLPESQDRAFFELGLGLRPVWMAGDRVTVALLVAAAVPVSRFRFYFASPDTTAYRLSAWSALAELSVGLRFL